MLLRVPPYDFPFVVSLLPNFPRLPLVTVWMLEGWSLCNTNESFWFIFPFFPFPRLCFSGGSLSFNWFGSEFSPPMALQLLHFIVVFFPCSPPLPCNCYCCTATLRAEKVTPVFPPFGPSSLFPESFFRPVPATFLAVAVLLKTLRGQSCHPNGLLGRRLHLAPPLFCTTFRSN